MSRGIPIITPLLRRVRDFAKGRAGAVTVEFVMYLPVFLYVMFGTIELSWLKTRQMMLNHSVDQVVRQLRLGAYPNLSGGLLVSEICDEGGDFLGRNCSQNIRIALTRVSTGSWGISDDLSQCQDRSQNLEPVIQFDPTSDNALMLIHVCLLVDPMLPGTQLALLLEETEGSGIRMHATSAFAVEPGGS